MITYQKEIMGTLTLVQQSGEFKIELRKSNCLACFIHVSHTTIVATQEKKVQHTLVLFFMDESHIKRCMKGRKKDFFNAMFNGTIKNIKLNLYYKESQALLKYMVRDGHKVQCYYKKED